MIELSVILIFSQPDKSESQCVRLERHRLPQALCQSSFEQFLRNKWYAPLSWLLQLTSYVTNWPRSQQHDCFLVCRRLAIWNNTVTQTVDKHACMLQTCMAAMSACTLSQNIVHNGEGTATLKSSADSPTNNCNDWNTKCAMMPRSVDGAYVQMGTRIRGSNHSNNDEW